MTGFYVFAMVASDFLSELKVIAREHRTEERLKMNAYLLPTLGLAPHPWLLFLFSSIAAPCINHV